MVTKKELSKISNYLELKLLMRHGQTAPMILAISPDGDGRIP